MLSKLSELEDLHNGNHDVNACPIETLKMEKFFFETTLKKLRKQYKLLICKI